jgi:integrative and conjugative element protein (TIGR02256 family)
MATTPKKADRQNRIAFERISAFHQKFAVRAWRRLGRTVDYLGEWHTHPESLPRPSGIDRSEWSRLTRLRTNELLFLILGMDGIWLGIAKHRQLHQIAQSGIACGVVQLTCNAQ